MFKNKYTRLYLIILTTILMLGGTYAAQDATILSYINKLQIIDSNLPSLANQKGYIGAILGEIFNGSGKIRQDYLDLSGVTIEGSSYTAGTGLVLNGTTFSTNLATTTITGIVMLENSTGSTSQTRAPTSNILKSVWDYIVAQITSINTSLTGKAPLASPALTGTPTAPTAVVGTNTTQIATTAFVKSQNYVTSSSAPVTSVASRTGAVVLTKTDVGLRNVTNDRQVKKLSSSTSGYIPTWNGTTGDSLANGYLVQTTLSSNTGALVRADAIQTALNGKANATEVVKKTRTKTARQFDTTTTNPSNVTRLNYDGNFYATNFYGNGANLTSLNGTNISAGTVADVRIASTIARTSQIVLKTRTKTARQFDTSTTNPSNITRLNYDGNFYATNFYGTSYNFFSDRRLKENIYTITGSLDKVNNLNGVYFDRKNTKVHDLGFIAQEVEKVEPKLVSTNENGLMSVKYANITALLVNAIKEISDKIDDLFHKYLSQESKIKAQQEEINSLKSDIKEIKENMYLMEYKSK